MACPPKSPSAEAMGGLKARRSVKLLNSLILSRHTSRTRQWMGVIGDGRARWVCVGAGPADYYNNSHVQPATSPLLLGDALSDGVVAGADRRPAEVEGRAEGLVPQRLGRVDDELAVAAHHDEAAWQGREDRQDVRKGAGRRGDVAGKLQRGGRR